MTGNISADDNQRTDELTDAEIDAFFERSTLPSDISISVTGNYQSEDEAKEVWNTTFLFFRMFGVFLNLQGLEAVTVADDYAETIAHIERGFETTRTLAPTKDSFGDGLAMAVPVLRKGELKTHIVFHSNLLRVLVTKTDAGGVAIHTMAHEAAHAHDHLMEAKMFPGLYGMTISDYKEGRMFLLAHMCWNEYIACQLSTRWGTDDYCKGYSDMLCSMLTSSRERGNAAIERYREHRDILKVESEVIDAYGTLLIRASYLVGHVHGLGTTVEETAPEFYRLVNQTSWFKPIFERYEANVRILYQSYGKWNGIEVFEPLKQTFESLLNAGGMFYYRLLDDHWRIGLKRPPA